VPAPSFASLNPSQQRAATHVEGPLLVLAGPGSGKTRVVTHRIAHLIAEGVPAERIVALTFTNKAADEMRRRVTELVGLQPVEMGTFHRFAARLLRRHARQVGLTSDYSILDPDDTGAVLKRAVKSLGITASHTPIDRIAGVISRAKNDLLTPQTFEPRWGRPVDDVALRVWPVYQRMLLQANSVDFDDLLIHVASLLAEDPGLRRELDARHRFILVDEYQDTNAVQYAILRGLSIDHPNLAVTGDPDQAIYGWRGASIRNILEFERDYPAATVVKLEDNYRSTSNILGTADRLIAHNTRRKPKRLVTTAGPGAPVRIVLDGSGLEEAERIADEIADAVAGGRRAARDVAILFRANALSRSFELALRGRGIAYQLVRGLEFFKRREIRDVVAWLRLLRNPRDDEAFLRVVNVPPRGIGKQSLDRLAAWAEDHGTSRLEAAAGAAAIDGMPKRAATSLASFSRLHANLARTAGREPSVAGLLEAVLDQTGYRAMLAAEQEDD
jgi:DNA helicase II / ATP-dependent DNA helicase PcrA